MKRSALLLPLALAGCGAIPDFAPEDVLTITCDAEAGACPGIADGRTQVHLAVCVPEAVTVRKDDLTATLRLPAGNAWLFPAPDAAADTVTEVPLSAQRCATPIFTPGNTAGPLRIEATVGTTVITSSLTLKPAALAELQIEPATGTFTVGTDDPITVTPRAAGGGSASAGTTLSFLVVDVQPAGEKAYIYPDVVTLDGASGTADLVTAGNAGAVTLRVTATPPADPDGDPVTSIEHEITLTGGP